MYDFPASPTNGQQYKASTGQTYIYNGTAWLLSAGTGGSGVTVGDNPPPAPVPGQLWFQSSTGNTFIWYVDQDSSQWVQFNVAPPIPLTPPDHIQSTPVDMWAGFINASGGPAFAINDKVDGTGATRMFVSENGDISMTGGFFVDNGIMSHKASTFEAGILAQDLNGTVSWGGLPSTLALDYAGPGATYGMMFRNRNGGPPATAINFYYGGTPSGTIAVSNGITAYNTTSDIRTKTSVRSADSARALVDALEVIEYQPVGDKVAREEVEGVTPGPDVFIGVSAQQAYGIYPAAVSPPDTTMPNYKADAKAGDEGFMPWMVDYSKFVPMLIANLQEANARIDALEARIAALEGGTR